jgi:hypothetical protein
LLGTLTMHTVHAWYEIIKQNRYHWQFQMAFYPISKRKEDKIVCYSSRAKFVLSYRSLAGQSLY